MTQTTDTGAAPDKEQFERAIHYFAQNISVPKAGKLPDEILDMPVILGFFTPENSTREVVATIRARLLLESMLQSDPVFIRTPNTPHFAGSRPDYSVVLMFDSSESASDYGAALGIERFGVHTFREVLEACMVQDNGIALVNERAISIIEADRVNEFGRASLPLIEKTETGNVLDKLSDISEEHNLRPEEVLELDGLLASQDWIVGQPLLGSATFDGMKANLLIVTPKPGLEREEIIGLVQALGQAVSQIKSPFLVVPVGGKAPVERGGLS